MHCHYRYSAASSVLLHIQEAQIRYWSGMGPASGFVLNYDREEMVSVESGNAALLPSPRSGHDVLLVANYPHGSVGFGSAQRLVARLHSLQRRCLES